ncbi:zinc-binding dehydrogenase [Flaviflexus massiliensis]|uniref:zinc-binding dehydrogenase n=1 Tax=Flaviflexus massiliensis TaxID=1522309 RepID=UPI0006D5309B|nr:zinc-binding dehydrogenase [Flaviflexus massiliensis]
MKAILLDQPGTPDTLRLGVIDEPTAGPGEILIRVHACGLNPVDVGVAGGGNPAWSWPHVLGLDAAGTIEALGEGVTEFEIGQHVVFHGDLRREGGLAEFVTAPATILATIPDEVTFEQAAALPCAGMTAFQAVHRRLHVSAGQTILITAGAGDVGGYAIQLAKKMGAKVITTCSEANIERVRKLGADEVINYRTENVVERVKELTNSRGVDAVIDTVSAESATENLSILVHGGGLVSIAGRPDGSVIEPFTYAVSLHEIALGAAHSHGDEKAQADLRAMLEELMAAVADGSLDPMLAHVVPLDQAPDALARIKTGHGHGRTVVTI